MNRSKQDFVNKKEQFWGPHIKKWKSSGITQAKYCEKNNLILRRFNYWKCKIDKKPVKSIELVQVETASVNIPKISIPDQPNIRLKLKITNIFEIEVADDFSQNTLRKVISVLGEYI